MDSFWVLTIISSMLAGCAVYAWLFWLDVGGLKGLALVVVSLCSALITGTFSLFYAGDLIVLDQMVLVQINDVLIPARWLSLIQQIFWIPLLLFLFMLVDIWAADHNSHRSLTARTYEWYSNLRGGK